MPLATWPRSANTRSEGHGSRRTSRRRSTTSKLRTEHLEDRLVFSGFGPEDGAYIIESRSGIFHDVQIQPSDQKIVVVGTWAARYDALGNVDAGFGTGGQAEVALGARALALQPDGKAVLTGDVGSNLAIARLDADGSPDAGFGSGGLSTFDIPTTTAESAYGIAVQSNGDIILGGNASLSGSRWAVVASFKANGAIENGGGGFGSQKQGYATAAFGGTFNHFADVAIQSDNKVVAVGSTYNPGVDKPALVVARFTTAGVLDTSFNGNGYSILQPGIDYTSASSVVLQSDGKIVVAGSSTGTDARGDMLVARFNSNGSLDTSFGGGDGYVRLDIDESATNTGELGFDAAIQPDGRIVIAGTGFVDGGSIDYQIVARLNPNGSLDGTFGTGGFKIAYPPAGADSFDGRSMALAANGDIIVAGNVRYGNPSYSQPFLMRFFGAPAAETKFYVVDDATANRTYEYADQGATVENYALAGGNAAPRGAASTSAGDKVWVVDANRNVYVYNAGGGLLGSWTAGTLANNATVEGIATDGTDVWIVDARSDKVFRYAGAASRLSGSQTAASSFSLNSGNTSPKDIVTDGSSLWVVNDSSTDKVFRYSIAGSLLGSWSIDAANATPTGITLDPTNVSDLWIVDSGTDRVYQYSAAASRISGSQSADAVFALAAGNTNPQGIADPPASGGESLPNSITSDVRRAAVLPTWPAARRQAEPEDAALVDRWFAESDELRTDLWLNAWLADELASARAGGRRQG